MRDSYSLFLRLAHSSEDGFLRLHTLYQQQVRNVKCLVAGAAQASPVLIEEALGQEDLDDVSARGAAQDNSSVEALAGETEEPAVGVELRGGGDEMSCSPWFTSCRVITLLLYCNCLSRRRREA